MILSFFIFKESQKNGQKFDKEIEIKDAIRQEFIEIFDIRDFDF